MDHYIGKMLDNRYEILERIGTGGMAVVYKAKCHRLNRLVAVKILKADLAQDEDFRRRFNAESQAVAQLSHANIVSVYDVSRGGDTEYIVMELIDGITLKQYMEKRGRLNWRESLHFITQIMRGISHAHSRGIIHRDIKPQNVMVLRDGSVKVADFGIACLENASQTLTQEALGSVHYVSPEQARGDRIDARSDIYSAGIVFYEMLTGRLPFEGDSPVSVAIQHLSSIPLSPREINPEIPQQLELICMKAMAPNLDRRYPSADAMIADLETFRKNPGISLDFDLTDLRPEIMDDPTTTLQDPSGTLHRVQTSRDRDLIRERERDREREYRSSHEYRQRPDYPEKRYDDMDDMNASRPDRTGKATQNLLGSRTALIALSVLIAAVGVFFLFRSIFSSFIEPEPEQFIVPSVTGRTVEEAQAMEGVSGIFVVQEVGREPSDIYAANQILRQEPKADERKKGENIPLKVWVSTGEDTGQMIDVTKLSYTAAVVAMKDLKDRYQLTLAPPEEQFSSDVGEGMVISTDPVKDEPLKKGDTIRFIVSKGPQTFPLLPFEHIKLDVAEKQLTSQGLFVGKIKEEPSDEYEKGEIISQDPEANTSVTEGDKVNFVVSSGPKEKVPDPEQNPPVQDEPNTPEQPDNNNNNNNNSNHNNDDNNQSSSTQTPEQPTTSTPNSTRTTKEIYIPVPVNQGLVHVRILQDDVEVINEMVDTSIWRSGNYPVRLTGSGTVMLDVYVDGELSPASGEITFGDS